MKVNKKSAMTWPAMLMLLCFTLIPLLIMFETSFRSDETGTLTLENYKKFFTNFMYSDKINIRNNALFRYIILFSIYSKLLLLNSQFV